MAKPWVFCLSYELFSWGLSFLGLEFFFSNGPKKSLAYIQALNAQKNWKTSILWLLAFASPKSILLLTTEEYPDAVSTFTVFALQIAISGLQCYFPIHKVWGQPGALQALLLFLLHKTTNETIYICMYVHCIGYRQRSVSVVMAPEPHSKSGFNLFCSVYLKREKILLEIYSKVHEWIFFLRSHDFCLSNSPEWSNSFPMKKKHQNICALV